MSKPLPRGNCPYCDSERGIYAGWAMSPELWDTLKENHDAGHPESVTGILAKGAREVLELAKKRIADFLEES